MDTKSVSGKRLILTAFYLLLYPAALLALAGDWLWIEGWVFNLWFLSVSTASITYLYRKDPGLLAERYQKPGTANQAGWDRWAVYGLQIGFIAWMVAMPLDARRFHWSGDFSLGLKIIGGLALVGSFVFFYRSFTDNPYLSPLVRIQRERHQQVATGGVYSFVRHPMYLGAVLLFLGTPLLLGSWGGWALGAALTALLAARIVGEERLLMAELDGYADYRKKVRYRLIPFIW